MARSKQKRAPETPRKPRRPPKRKRRIALSYVSAIGVWVEPLPKR